MRPPAASPPRTPAAGRGWAPAGGCAWRGEAGGEGEGKGWEKDGGASMRYRLGRTRSGQGGWWWAALLHTGQPRHPPSPSPPQHSPVQELAQLGDDLRVGVALKCLALLHLPGAGGGGSEWGKQVSWVLFKSVVLAWA